MQKKWYKKFWGITLLTTITLIIIIVIATVFYIFNLAKNIKKENTTQFSTNKSLYKKTGYKKIIEGENNYWYGSATPKITIVEFGDFNCHLCKNSWSKIRKISNIYKNDVKYIYRNFPIYDNSVDLSMATHCAGEQGLFWIIHDKLFQNQGKYTKNNILFLANQIGADIDKFNSCFNSNKYLNVIKKNIFDANKLELSGTPTWFINGSRIDGDIPYEIFTQIIENILEETKLSH